ncbi:MAG: hypothetical protein RMJ87_06960 [Cytophagales bacterium]|nr:hypothetical protein [Bernardetiaceae bacterium]MDW8204750.1 hypothetical protein [Cytophagales bacterium]
MKRIFIAHTPLLILLATLCILLAATSVNYYQKTNRLSHALQAARAKIIQDSIQIANSEQIGKKLQLVLIQYAKDSAFVQNPNWLELLNTVLASYHAKNQLLNQQNSTQRKEIEDFKTLLSVTNSQLHFAESQTQEAETAIALLAADLREKTRATDSMAAELAQLRFALEQSTVDSISLLSPKGNKIFYYGKLLNGLPNEFGIGFYQGRGYYIGEWQGNARHGKGKHFYKDGSVYEGNFENDLRAGFGIYYYASGEIYRGYWKDDLMNGQGEIIGIDKKAISGIWENGKLQQRR